MFLTWTNVCSSEHASLSPGFLQLVLQLCKYNTAVVGSRPWNCALNNYITTENFSVILYKNNFYFFFCYSSIQLLSIIWSDLKKFSNASNTINSWLCLRGVLPFTCSKTASVTVFGWGCSSCPSSAGPSAQQQTGAPHRSQGWTCDRQSTRRRTRLRSVHWTCSWKAEIWDKRGKEQADYIDAS